jgi:transposase
MGYRVITVEMIYEAFRRWHAGQKISHISKAEGLDRKTIRDYLSQLEAQGYTREAPFPRRDELSAAIKQVLPIREKKQSRREKLEDYTEEIKGLIHDPKEPVLPKTAYEIITAKYNLNVSYSTFKRFVRSKGIQRQPQPSIIRIELPPGLETQLDYGKTGMLFDAEAKRNRVVYAFCGILSHSRLPYIEYTYTQKQESFTASAVDMFEFYGGSTEIVSIDNLKSGVIKPDLYDPKFNKSFSEMAEHYGVFIDPCRVGTPTDKGKVERLVPSARELFRKLKKLYPTADIHQLNRLSREWCLNEYGMREHGTTKEMPRTAFEEREKKALRPLPAERFRVPYWKKATVHPDQFFSYDKKRYSMPSKYRGQEVWIRQCGAILQIYHEHILIREYVFKEQVINYVPEDFPETVREMMNGGYPKYLLDRARKFGDIPCRFVESVLQPHAYLNSRRARGMLSVMEAYNHKSFFVDVCRKAMTRRVKLPKTFKQMLNHEDEQLTLDMSIEMSDEGFAMVRDISDIFN